MYPTLPSWHLWLDVSTGIADIQRFSCSFLSLALGWGNRIDLITLQLVIATYRSKENPF